MSDDDVTRLLSDHRVRDVDRGRTRIDRAGVIAEIGERPAMVIDAWIVAHGGSVDRTDDVYEVPQDALGPAV